MLSRKGIQINDRDFFRDPFTRDEITYLLKGKSASEMFNFRSPSFKQLGSSRETLSDDNLIDLMLKEPRLVRRPIVRIWDEVYFSADSSVLEGLIH